MGKKIAQKFMADKGRGQYLETIRKPVERIEVKKRASFLHFFMRGGLIA
jgi:hypothetical protein